MENNNSGVNVKIVSAIGVILAISIALNVVQFLDKLPPGKKRVLAENNLKLSSRIRNVQNELNKYKGLNAHLDDVVDEANKKIEKQEHKIYRLSADKEKAIKESEQLMTKINQLHEQYLDVIDSLLLEQQQNAAVQQTVNNLEEEINLLKERIGRATLFIADNEKVQAEKVRASGQKHPTALARKTTSLQVCFDLVENKIIKPGDYTMYMRVLSPEAIVLTDNNNSGKFMHPELNKKVDYTISKNIKYQNDKINVCINWDNPQSLKPGVYVVELFTEKQKLGTSTLTLK